ncbi:AraC family transcriptional regulator [Saprospiraceae bacterium]|nr:AraC family transcriptional regulator [Saprospiraceae bacterium]
MTDPKHIAFNNQIKPNAGFDIVPLQELMNRKLMDHQIDKLHLVEFFILIVITDGSGQHTIDFTTYDCKKGSVLTVRKDQIHRFHKESNMDGLLIMFTDDFLVSYLEKLAAQRSLQLFNEQLGLPQINLKQDSYNDFSETVSKISKEYYDVDDEYTLGIIRSSLHILLTKLYRIKSKSEQSFQGKKYLKEFIKFQNLVELECERTRKVSDYAKMMAISSKTLNTITREIVHISAKNFIDDICIKQIKRQLINTDLTVNEIAYATGFEETTNFYKYFKRLVQSTPEQFRLTH